MSGISDMICESSTPASRLGRDAGGSKRRIGIDSTELVDCWCFPDNDRGGDRVCGCDRGGGIGVGVGGGGGGWEGEGEGEGEGEEVGAGVCGGCDFGGGRGVNAGVLACVRVRLGGEGERSAETWRVR